MLDSLSIFAILVPNNITNQQLVLLAGWLALDSQPVGGWGEKGRNARQVSAPPPPDKRRHVRFQIYAIVTGTLKYTQFFPVTHTLQ